MTLSSQCLFAHSLRKFSMRDWGIEQKWMGILLPLLLLYNGVCMRHGAGGVGGLCEGMSLCGSGSPVWPCVEKGPVWELVIVGECGVGGVYSCGVCPQRSIPCGSGDFMSLCIPFWVSAPPHHVQLRWHMGTYHNAAMCPCPVSFPARVQRSKTSGCRLALVSSWL